MALGAKRYGGWSADDSMMRCHVGGHVGEQAVVSAGRYKRYVTTGTRDCGAGSVPYCRP